MEQLNKTIFNGNEEWLEACVTREKSKNKIKTGIKFIDDVTNGGLVYDDFVLISADTGIGKTEYACMLAENFAESNKRVLYFGLEMSKGEGLNRIAFRKLIEICQKDYPNKYFDYGMFKAKQLDEYIMQYKTDFDKKMTKVKQNISWRRKDTTFDLTTLKKELIEQKDNFDVFIVDHLSMIGTESENENKEVYQIIKEIDYFCSEFEKPVLLVVHIRKSQSNVKTYMPRAHEIAGTKHIINIPKRIIMLSRDYDTPSKNGRYPTFCRLLKNRDDGKTNYVSRLVFDVKTSTYETVYNLLRDKGNCLEVGDIEDNEIPDWAKHEVRRYSDDKFSFINRR